MGNVAQISFDGNKLSHQALIHNLYGVHSEKKYLVVAEFIE